MVGVPPDNNAAETVGIRRFPSHPVMIPLRNRLAHANCRGRQLGDPWLPEQLVALYGIGCRYLPLASPGGKLDFLSNGTSEPVDKKA